MSNENIGFYLDKNVDFSDEEMSEVDLSNFDSEDAESFSSEPAEDAIAFSTVGDLWEDTQNLQIIEEIQDGKCPKFPKSPCQQFLKGRRNFLNKSKLDPFVEIFTRNW